jgi:hypothetical protein
MLEFLVRVRDSLAYFAAYLGGVAWYCGAAAFAWVFAVVAGALFLSLDAEGTEQ